MDITTLSRIPPWDWPDGTAELVLGVLRDGSADEEARLLAAELAGDGTIVDDDLAEALLDVVRSGEESVAIRGTAAIALRPVLEEYDAEFAGPDIGPFSSDLLPITVATFQNVQETFRRLYLDAGVPEEVRRRILEASVRSVQEWHADAVRAAYASDDEEWQLTAVFCMQYVAGFGDEILQALQSDDRAVLLDAVGAAGAWEIAEAWPRVVSLVRANGTDTPLRIVAIEAVGAIRPRQAEEELADLLDSDDEDIVDAVLETITMAGFRPDDEPGDVPFELPVEAARTSPPRGFGELDEILVELWTYDGVYKRDAVEMAIQHRDEATPGLLRILERVLEDPQGHVADENFEGAIYAAVLLRHFHEPRAHPLLMRLARLPEDQLFGLFGDLVTEEFAGIFYATCDGELDELKSLVQDRNADQYVRCAAMRALVLAVADGAAPRDEIVAFLQGLFTGDEADPDSGFWSFAAVDLERLYPEESMDLITDAYARHLIDPFHIGPEAFERALAEGREAADAHLTADLRHALPDDLHARMSRWACFRSEDSLDDDLSEMRRGFAAAGLVEETPKPSKKVRQQKKKRRKQQKKARKQGRKKKKRKR